MSVRANEKTQCRAETFPFVACSITINEKKNEIKHFGNQTSKLARRGWSLISVSYGLKKRSENVWGYVIAVMDEASTGMDLKAFIN